MFKCKRPAPPKRQVKCRAPTRRPPRGDLPPEQITCFSPLWHVLLYCCLGRRGMAVSSAAASILQSCIRYYLLEVVPHTTGCTDRPCLPAVVVCSVGGDAGCRAGRAYGRARWHDDESEKWVLVTGRTHQVTCCVASANNQDLSPLKRKEHATREARIAAGPWVLQVCRESQPNTHMHENGCFLNSSRESDGEIRHKRCRSCREHTEVFLELLPDKKRKQPASCLRSPRPEP